MNRTFTIGDIHGGLRALQRVLNLAGVTRNDRLIFLGDYVDGWSESAQVISFLEGLDAAMECVFLKGNHDELCESWLRDGTIDERWLEAERTSTQQSYSQFSPAEKLRHLAFLERMSYMFVDEANRLFIHAGFTNQRGPANERVKSYLTWDRSLWEMALALDPSIPPESSRYPKRLRLFHEIFVGHTPTLYQNETRPMQAGNVWNLDTGAAFTGALTIMDVETKECWQSDPVWKLYDGEKGRNK